MADTFFGFDPAQPVSVKQIRNEISMEIIWTGFIDVMKINKYCIENSKPKKAHFSSSNLISTECNLF